MEIILWRHAQAEVGEAEQPDAERQLTPQGRKQAARMGDQAVHPAELVSELVAGGEVQVFAITDALARKDAGAALAAQARDRSPRELEPEPPVSTQRQL